MLEEEEKEEEEEEEERERVERRELNMFVLKDISLKHSGQLSLHAAVRETYPRSKLLFGVRRTIQYWDVLQHQGEVGRKSEGTV
jgi:hypothetical protein